MTEYYAQQLVSLVENDPWRMDALRAVRVLNLNDCWTGAGFVRCLIWDHLSGHADATPLRDIDVVYYDPVDTREETEKEYDRQLLLLMQGVPWSCKNQARMYLKFGAGTPYKNTEDGLRHWLETSAAVAVRLSPDNHVEILAPFGLDDIFNLRIRPTPFACAHKMDQYIHLARTKRWQDRWPRLEILSENGSQLILPV